MGKKCGVVVDPPRLVITYAKPPTVTCGGGGGGGGNGNGGSVSDRRHVIPLRKFSRNSDVTRYRKKLESTQRYSQYIAVVKSRQVLHCRLYCIYIYIYMRDVYKDSKL